MATEPPLECPCPPTGTLDVLGKKWALCVVTLLGRHGPLRFGPIQRSLPGVSPATLTSTLRALEEERCVEREARPGPRGSPVTYRLTPRGEALDRTLRPFAAWLRRG